MPIRKRDFTADEPASFEVQIEDVFDNVTKLDRADDDRGVFDPKADPYPGSFYAGLGVPKEAVRAVAGYFAYTMPDLVPTPKQMRVQDLLVNVRLSPNHDSVEQSYRNRVRSPLTAIRAHCVSCKGGSPRAVSTCDVVECPFWALRMGTNAHRNRG